MSVACLISAVESKIIKNSIVMERFDSSLTATDSYWLCVVMVSNLIISTHESLHAEVGLNFIRLDSGSYRASLCKSGAQKTGDGD